MSEVAYTLVRDESRVKVIQWELTNGDTGQWYKYSGMFPDKFFQVFGTWGSGGSCKPEGTNEDYDKPPAKAVQLRDSTHTVLAFTSDGGDTLLQNPMMVRPNCSAGDDTTALTVLLCLTVPHR